MAETMRKVKVAAKPKTAAKRKTRPRLMKLAIVPHEEIEKLAHRFWTERGYSHGQAELDWYRAEQQLRSQAS